MNINKDKRSETHSRHEAVVQVFIREQDPIFDEDGAGSQDEGEEQVHVDVVPGAVELPVQKKKKEKKKHFVFTSITYFLNPPWKVSVPVSVPGLTFHYPNGNLLTCTVNTAPQFKCHFVYCTAALFTFCSASISARSSFRKHK